MENVDIELLIYEYSPAEAIQLAPSDQVRLVRRITGATVPPISAEGILLLLSGVKNTPLITAGISAESRIQLVRYLTNSELNAGDAFTFLNHLSSIDTRRSWRRLRSIDELTPWLEASYSYEEFIARELVAIPQLPFSETLQFNYYQLAEDILSATLNCASVDFLALLTELRAPRPDPVVIEAHRVDFDHEILFKLVSNEYYGDIGPEQSELLLRSIRECYEGREIELNRIALEKRGDWC